MAVVIVKSTTSTSDTAAAAVILVISHGAYYFLHQTAQSQVDAWKFAFGVPVTLLVVALLGSWFARGHRPAFVLGMLGIASVNVFLGFRSLAGLVIMAAVLLLLSGKGPRRAIPRVLTLAAIAAVAGLAISVYGALANSGALGEEQELKFRYAENTSAGLLIASRPEIVVSATAISHRPLLGYGPSGEVPSEVQNEGLVRSAQLGLNTDFGQRVRLFGQGLNAHSILLGSWVRTGVFGSAFWFVCLALVVVPLWRMHFVQHWSQPFLVLGLLLTAWDLIFSPWSPHYSVMLAGFVALAARSAGGPVK